MMYRRRPDVNCAPIRSQRRTWPLPPKRPGWNEFQKPRVMRLGNSSVSDLICCQRWCPDAVHADRLVLAGPGGHGAHNEGERLRSDSAELEVRAKRDGQRVAG